MVGRARAPRGAAAMLATAVGMGALWGLGLARARVEVEKTPFPCKGAYDDADVAGWVSKHLAGAKDGNGQPHMLLMLGGSGAGKGTFLKRWKEYEQAGAGATSSTRIGDFVTHGLDEYLEYIPEYAKSIGDPESVYKDAADSCYSGAAIPAAKLANDEIIAKKMHLIYEETGKNLDRIKKRVLPPFIDAGYRITVVLIDNDADTAISRAAGRFQLTGRYAPEDYIRGTFGNCFSSFEALKRMEVVSEAVYCDNSGAEMRCWADGARPEAALVPEGLLRAGAPAYRGAGAGQGAAAAGEL